MGTRKMITCTPAIREGKNQRMMDFNNIFRVPFQQVETPRTQKGRGQIDGLMSPPVFADVPSVNYRIKKYLENGR